MAQWLNWGDGSDGSPNAISGTVNTYAACTGTSGQAVLTTALAASAGDQILIHQSQGTGAGTWEIVKVTSDAGATLNLATALVNSYTTGAQAILIPQYTGGTLSGAVTCQAWNGSTGGIIALLSNGDLTISGSLTGTTQGFTGGTIPSPANGKQGVGTLGAGTTSTAANGNGGGGGTVSSSQRGGGGGGGNGTAGTAGQSVAPATGGTAGAAAGNAELTTFVLGGGGGTGGVQNNGGSTGGNGGGGVFIFAKNFTLTGTIPLTGGNGAYSQDRGGSGGGAGGSCLIKTQVAVLGTNKITAAGGAGGTPGESGFSGVGGAGSAGRIRCDYFTSISGSTTPTLSSAQDTSLNVAGGSGFFNFF